MPMNSDQVLDALDKIAATSGRNDKEALVAEGASDPLFRAVLVAAYDPFTTYGVTDVGPHLGIQERVFENNQVPPVLQMLAKRELTGNAALQAMKNLGGAYTAKTIELVRRIVTKDLRAGFTAGTCNRAEPGMIAVFEVMLAHKFEAKRIKAWPVAVEPKLDGVRVACIAKVTTGEVSFLSRNGKPFPAVDHLKQPMLDFLAQAGVFYDVFLDGEMVAGSFNKTVGDVRRKSVAATDTLYHVYDGARLTDFASGASVPFKHRRAWVEGLFSQQRDESAFKLGELDLAMSIEEVLELYNGYRARGLEGAIVKPLDAVYQKKRSYAWLKVKGEETEDLRVVSAFEGAGKYAGKLGGLVVDFKGVEVRVGGGFSDAQREELWRDLMTETVGSSKVIGRLMEVEYHEVTLDGSLRHPRFVRWRDDKDMNLAA